MIFGDLKRAIEDTILKPETNRLSDIGKRTTIAALDLVQVEQTRSNTSPNLNNEGYLDSVGALNLCSHEPVSSLAESGYTTSSTTSESVVQPTQSFSSSNSLETVVLRQSISCRPSLGTSRRSSRVLPHYSQTKRKRSNSVSSCMNKSRHTRQGAFSATGVSCTSAGGASALSLPPTARQTPFRFGDVEDKVQGHSNSSEGPSPLFSLIPHEDSFDTHQKQDLNDRSGLETCGGRSDWSSASFIDNNVFRNNVDVKPTFRKHESEKLLRDVRPVNEITNGAFNGFRYQVGNNSDYDEEMECD